MKLGLLLLAAPALAQLTVSFAGPEGETAVDNIATLAMTDPGDTLNTRFRLRNPTGATIRLTALRISGTAFSLDGHPTLPYLVAPDTNVDFTVRFAPAAFGSYSATLQINERLILVRADARLAAVLLVEGEGGWQAIDARYPVDFGRIAANRTASRRFLLRNESASVARVSQILVSGAGFDAEGVIALPAELPPRAEVAFRVQFVPRRTGIFRGQLRVDTRTVLLDGASFDPPLPPSTIELPSDAAESGRQVTGAVRFAEPAEAAGAVRLSLRFQPAAAGTADDMTIQFLPAASRAIEIPVAEGAREVPFVFQTGATAGTIALRLEAGLFPREATLAIPAAAARLQRVEVGREPGAIAVRIEGFDNTRSASRAVFRFTERSGRVHDPIATDVERAFAEHFRESPLGGLFALRLRFPVTGDAAQIVTVQVELQTAVGTAVSGPHAF